MALEDYRSVMGRCSRCSYCKWVPFAALKSARFAKGCPSIEYNKFHSYSASGRLSVGRALLEKRFDYSDSDSLKDVVYKCLMDGSCDIACKVNRNNMEPLDALRELRFRLNENGEILPEHLLYIDSLRKEDNMMLGIRSERGNWAEGLDVKHVINEPSEVLFHAGCRFSYDKELQKVARTAVTLLKEAKVDIGIMGKDESCCGGRAYYMGYYGEFTKFAENNISLWKNSGVKTVVTSCSDCYHAFKRLYAENGSKVEVFHTIEFINRLIKDGKIKFTKKIPMKVTYHDPCHLGRLGEPYVPWDGVERKIRGQIVIHDPPKPRYNGSRGVYESPREVLRSIPGLELVEMERIREYAWCCGSGGGAKEAYPDFSLWTAGERIEEAKSTGADALVTACGWCERNFIDSINKNRERLRVYDIVELLQQAI